MHVEFFNYSGLHCEFACKTSILYAAEYQLTTVDKRNEKYASNNTVSRYPDRVESPVAKTSGNLQFCLHFDYSLGADSRYIDV